MHLEVFDPPLCCPTGVCGPSVVGPLRGAMPPAVILVTLPEATPVHEAAALQSDLRRAGIEPFAWVVNQSFAATATADVALVARGRHERACIDEVRTSLARQTAVVAWQAERPVGADALLSLAQAGAAELLAVGA